MPKRSHLFIAVGILLTVSAAVVVLIPSDPPKAMPRTFAVSPVDHAATIEALKPPKRARPVVAVLGNNDGTEVTDFVVPYGVLRESGRAEVVALAVDTKPIKL